ncbi:MAG TPA: glycosyltransferase family 2 protein [Vicinamibacteria bacterium]|nr:glycosyltransferase family 2 protein [Vicinamibacteria bacterium]
MPTVSVIAPVFDEAPLVREFLERTRKALLPLEARYEFEIVLVNDGSRDGSLEVMKSCLATEPRLRIVDLARNYGQTAALQAGLDAARGDILVTLDADLQHFPEEIPRFLEGIERGYDLVCGWRHHRAEGIRRRWPSRVANWLIRGISGLRLHDFGTTFRAYRSDLAHEIRLFGEFHRYVPVLAHVAGARILEIPIENVERPAGRSKYGLGRTRGVLLDLIVLLFLARYLDRPMRIFGALGLLGLTAGGGILAFLLGYAYLYDVPTVRLYSGWFLMSIMLLLASVQVILTGILAELLVRVHYGIGDRRVYRVRREWSGPDAGARG